ncbi:MAG: hypothetical protein ACYDEE_17730 [Ignavibacteriaceae bacterium]
MKRVGFIGEGESETIILNSDSFQDLLNRKKVESVGVFDAGGIDNLKNYNTKVDSFIKIFNDRKADKIFFLGDLDFEKCLVNQKNSFYRYDEKQVIVISVRAIEAWYLADSVTLSSIFKKKYIYSQPENTEDLPFEVLKKEFLKETGRGIGSKVRLSHYMIRNGFSIENAIQHKNCKSIQYFFIKLFTN